MADLQKQFETGGSTLAVPVSPNSSPSTPDNISVVGNSLLHNEYSNVGTPETSPPAYTSQLGEQAFGQQEQSNRYANNIPDGAIGGV